jgi:hypothetical protein
MIDPGKKTDIEIEELCDFDEAPLWIYAEGHHDRAAFLAALRDWERETAGDAEDLYRVQDVRHVWLHRQPTSDEEAVYSYSIVGPGYPGAFPVTLVDVL